MKIFEGGQGEIERRSQNTGRHRVSWQQYGTLLGEEMSAYACIQ